MNTSFAIVHNWLLKYFLCFILGAFVTANAHDMKFGVIDAVEVNSGQYQMTFRYSSTKLDLGKISLKQADPCQVSDFLDSSAPGYQVKFVWQATCNSYSTTPLYPRFTLFGLPNEQQLFVRILQADGMVFEKMVNSNQIDLASIVSDSPLQQKSKDARQYLQFGFFHILEGYDHLLVVLCFVMFFVRLRTVLLVVTGFTIGHSVSLIVAAGFGWQMPVELVEIFIVLSVSFMAREIYFSSSSSILRKHPIVMSCLIGLLHGLGFANAITELGLPDQQKFGAILFFNLGVELGQLLCALVGIIILYGLTRFVFSQERLRKLVSIIVGATSIVWLMQLFNHG